MLTVRSTTRPVEEILSDSEHVLAVIEFDPESPTSNADPRRMTIPLRAAGRVREVWTTTEPVLTTKVSRQLQLCRTQHVTLGVVTVDDSEDDVEGAAERAYRSLLGSLGKDSHPCLWRVWNYFPRITEGLGDQERYRRFSVGRARALEAAGVPDTELPPATAIGTSSGPWVVMFIAGTAPCTPLENPRQTSAYRYPRRYGPVSPSFARAALVSNDSSPCALIVSGTASIVGHETRHPGRWRKQLEEIHKNLLSLQTNARIDQNPSFLRIYVRPHLPVEAVRGAVQELWGRSVPIVTLEGDICRQDLLLEIEGWWNLSP